MRYLPILSHSRESEYFTNFCFSCLFGCRESWGERKESDLRPFGSWSSYCLIHGDVCLFCLQLPIRSFGEWNQAEHYCVLGDWLWQDSDCRHASPELRLSSPQAVAFCGGFPGPASCPGCSSTSQTTYIVRFYTMPISLIVFRIFRSYANCKDFDFSLWHQHKCLKVHLF